ncbi:hypothetical protein OAX78_00855 [Planctomycetota bacterium]|nr:hypothetical protein [Planctomycetota bacterium]
MSDASTTAEDSEQSEVYRLLRDALSEEDDRLASLESRIRSLQDRWTGHHQASPIPQPPADFGQDPAPEGEVEVSRGPNFNAAPTLLDVNAQLAEEDGEDYSPIGALDTRELSRPDSGGTARPNTAGLPRPDTRSWPEEEVEAPAPQRSRRDVDFRPTEAIQRSRLNLPDEPPAVAAPMPEEPDVTTPYQRRDLDFRPTGDLDRAQLAAELARAEESVPSDSEESRDWLALGDPPVPEDRSERPTKAMPLRLVDDITPPPYAGAARQHVPDSAEHEWLDDMRTAPLEVTRRTLDDDDLGDSAGTDRVVAPEQEAADLAQRASEYRAASRRLEPENGPGSPVPFDERPTIWGRRSDAKLEGSSPDDETEAGWRKPQNEAPKVRPSDLPPTDSSGSVQMGRGAYTVSGAQRRGEEANRFGLERAFGRGDEVDLDAMLERQEELFTVVRRVEHTLEKLANAVAEQAHRVGKVGDLEHAVNDVSRLAMAGIKRVNDLEDEVEELRSGAIPRPADDEDLTDVIARPLPDAPEPSRPEPVAQLSPPPQPPEAAAPLPAAPLTAAPLTAAPLTAAPLPAAPLPAAPLPAHELDNSLTVTQRLARFLRDSVDSMPEAEEFTEEPDEEADEHSRAVLAMRAELLHMGAEYQTLIEGHGRFLERLVGLFEHELHID